MPFRSEAQRRYLWKFHPDIARRWAHEQHSSSRNHRMPSKDGPDVHHARKKTRKSRRAAARKHRR